MLPKSLLTDAWWLDGDVIITQPSKNRRAAPQPKRCYRIVKIRAILGQKDDRTVHGTENPHS